MQRSLFVPVAVIALAMTILLGCGGGGKKGTGGTNGTTGGNPDPSDVAFVKVVAVAPGSTTTRDLSNTVVGESLTVQGISVDYKGVATVVSFTNLATNAPQTVARVSSSTGLLTALGPSSSTYTVSGRYKGKTYSTELNVFEAATRAAVTGNLQSFTGASAAGTTIRFLGATGSTVIASATVGADGTYQANVPVGSARFTVDTSALVGTDNKPLYYNEFSFGTDSDGATLSYIATLSCPAPLPSNGATPGVTLYPVSAGVIPPVPNGCVGGG